MPNPNDSVITKIRYSDNQTTEDFNLGVSFDNVFTQDSDNLSNEFTLKKMYDFLKQFFAEAPFTSWTYGEAMPYDPRIKTWFHIS